ncbi:arrestin domain containing 4 [Planoprotostelium fungivorum]|uniref:Arrestin domain containing 4 n=1 Tax=Planoprotostelium fungivorum TaxID=1890364 RepID=A0A2P6NQT2_9EUKA|nr:arrestin domain containing 4 [Planoprotostelium fungivorum]
MLKVRISKQCYCPGEPVTGTVEFDQKKNIDILGLDIQLKAFEHTEWPSNGLNVDNHANLEGRLTHSRKRRPISKTNQTLIPTGTLNRGSYVLPFSITIPENTPPSMSYREGKVRVVHQLKASLKVKGSRPTVSVRIFQVGNIYMIDPNVSTRVGEATKSFLLAQNERPLVLRAQLNREMAQCGTTIMAYVDVDNFTSRSLHNFVVKIKRVIQYGTRLDRQTIRKLNFNPHIATGMTWRGRVPIMIPAGLDICPTVDNAEIIAVRYFVGVHIKVLGAKRAVVELPFRVSIFPAIIPRYPSDAILPFEQLLQASHPVLQPESVINLTPLESSGASVLPELPGLMTHSRSVAPPLPSRESKRFSREIYQNNVDMTDVDNAIATIKNCIEDLETASYYAKMGQISQVSEYQAGSSFERSKLEVIREADGSSLVQRELVEISSRTPTDSNVSSGALHLAQNIVGLTYYLKQAAALLAEISQQSVMISSGQSVAVAVFRLFLGIKNFRGNSAVDTGDLIREAGRDVDVSITALLQLLDQLSQDQRNVESQLLTTQRAIEDYLVSFSLSSAPLNTANDKVYSKEEMRALAERLSVTLEALVTATSRGSLNSAMSDLQRALANFLEAAKSCPNGNSNEVVARGSKIIRGTSTLIDSVIYNGDRTIASAEISSVVDEINRLAVLLQGGNAQPSSFQLRPDLLAAIASVQNAGQRLTQLAKTSSSSGAMIPLRETSGTEGERNVMDRLCEELTRDARDIMELTMESDEPSSERLLATSAASIAGCTSKVTAIARSSPLVYEQLEMATEEMKDILSRFLSSTSTTSTPLQQDKFRGLANDIVRQMESICQCGKRLRGHEEREEMDRRMKNLVFERPMQSDGPNAKTVI